MAYGMRPDAPTLARLAAAEDDLAKAGPLGDFRLRLTPEAVLQAENMPDSQRQQVQNILQRHGFWPCKMEIGGSVSGFWRMLAVLGINNNVFCMFLAPRGCFRPHMRLRAGLCQ